MGQDKGSLIKKSKGHVQKQEEKYLLCYQQVILSSWEARSQYTEVALEDKHLNNKTSPSPCILLAFTVPLVIGYPLGLFGSAVLATSPPKLSPTSSPVAFGRRLERQPWGCTCTAQHQLKHWCIINNLPELQSTAAWELPRKVRTLSDKSGTAVQCI